MTEEEVLAIAASVQALPTNESFQALAFDDVVHNRMYTSDEKFLDDYSYAEVQDAAKQIQNSGLPLVDGVSYFNTGNPEINEALYGPTISKNLSYNKTGYETPRNLEQDDLFDALKAAPLAIATGAIAGGLFNAIPGLIPNQGITGLAGSSAATSAANTAATIGQFAAGAAPSVLSPSDGPGTAAQVAQSVFGGVTGVGQSNESIIHGGGPLSGGAQVDFENGTINDYLGVSLPGPIDTGPLILQNILSGILDATTNSSPSASTSGGSSSSGTSGGSSGSGESGGGEEEEGGLTLGGLPGVSFPSPQPSNLVGQMFPEIAGTNTGSDTPTPAPIAPPGADAELSSGQILNPPELGPPDAGFNPSITITQNPSPLPGFNPGPRSGLLVSDDPVGRAENPPTTQTGLFSEGSSGSGGGGGAVGAGSGNADDFLEGIAYAPEMINRIPVSVRNYLAELFGG